MINSQLEKINKYTRRPLSADEVYIFSVILCDNDIDRDGERFSEKALEQLGGLFVGRTGIFDHDAKSSKQSARIFDTELKEDSSRTTKNGDTYRYLTGYAYMVRTDDNKSLIAEIDGGIKKEVSVSCSASRRICSVCGSDKAKTGCTHVKGREYGGRVCHTVLDDITDAYEWSFVAVPAQVNAGVTKQYTQQNGAVCDTDMTQTLLKDIRRLSFACGGTAEADFASRRAKGMDNSALEQLRKYYEGRLPRRDTGLQLSACTGEACEADYSTR